MNKAQKEVLQAGIRDEQHTIKLLQAVYKQASKDCADRIAALSGRTDLENLQTIIWQKQYQQALKKQLDGIIDQMGSEQFTTVADYLQKCYTNGYTGVMYDLNKQGIPCTVPINQKQVVKALEIDSKISKGLYTRMGEDVDHLKKSIRAEVSRGVANGSSWGEIAQHIANGMNSPFDRAINNTIRIARTEGHRVQQQSTLDAQKAAQETGAKIKKQWCSTLDDRTRDTHRQLDGVIVDVDEEFTLPGGLHAQYPGGFGDPAEDCNCRCCLLQRAVWGLDEDELDTLKDRADFFGLDKSDQFEDFREKYLNLPEDADTVDVPDFLQHTSKLKGSMKDEDYQEYTELLQNHSNPDVKRMYDHADEVKAVRYKSGGGRYSPSLNDIEYSYPSQQNIDGGMSKYSTVAHEYGHFFDAKCDYGDAVHFKEIDAIHAELQYPQQFKRVASSSDEFLAAVRQDKAELQKRLTGDILKAMKGDDASAGVQDAVDGLLGKRVAWGHGDRYYNRKYNAAKQFGDHKGLQSVYKSLGFDASNQAKTQSIARTYEAASEMWANMMSAEVCGGRELDYVKDYLPNSYQAMLKIMKGVK